MLVTGAHLYDISNKMEFLQIKDAMHSVVEGSPKPHVLMVV